jgi:hypothetical protein
MGFSHIWDILGPSRRCLLSGGWDYRGKSNYYYYIYHYIDCCNQKGGNVQVSGDIWCTTSAQLKSIWLLPRAQVAQLKTGSWQSLELKQSQPFEAADDFAVEHQLLPTCDAQSPRSPSWTFQRTQNNLGWDETIALLDSGVVTCFYHFSS